MKILVRPRQAGKTHELIKLAATDGLVIVCPSLDSARRAARKAADMGLKIPPPVIWHDFARGHARGAKGYVIDNLDLCVQQMAAGVPVAAVSLTGNAELASAAVSNAKLTIRELDWAPGSYQWDCPACDGCGNITPPMFREPSAKWHDCPAAGKRPGTVRVRLLGGYLDGQTREIAADAVFPGVVACFPAATDIAPSGMLRYRDSGRIWVAPGEEPAYIYALVTEPPA